MMACPLITAHWTRAEHLTQAGPMDSKEFEIGLREAKLQSGWFLVKRENLETVGSSSSLIHGLGSRESQSASTGDKSANRRVRRRREGKGS